ncbi:uncharacterized protein FPRO_11514 [Fusarium proliferatum ET1]|uniref:Related to ubiquitin--protein ligase n=1 Tax=Fusarium proliferatum (strain ET1) TaxID=1227346 RepID=A0A1L7W092_FUSPR|nr:uncharacterized protein FPRO_11514 [Fusarium proliferatum ET1]CZR46067.1 related to ubiquitin--protein ligase [Fusarium proliferatum ET1]
MDTAAMSSRLRQLAKELQDCQDTGVNLQPGNPDDLTHLVASLSIPPDTPYCGGTYTINVLVPDDYPFTKPSMKFNQRIYHPNVNAGAPATETDSASYGGYNRNLMDQFVALGYDKDAVVKAFEYVGIDRNNGEDYSLEEAYQGDILAKLSNV